MSFSEPVSGGGSGGGDTDDSTNDSTDDSTDDSTGDDGGGGWFGGGDGGGGSGGGGIDGWSDLSLPPAVQALANNPQNFVIGALAAALVEWVFEGVTLVVDTILLVLVGSEPTEFNAPGETLGLADVPVAIAQNIGSAGDTAGSGIIEGIEAFNEPIFEAAAFAGPATPLVIVAIGSVETIAVLWLLQRAVYVIADWLQLGGLTE